MTDGVILSSVREQLDLVGVVYTTTEGDSMRPLFHTHGGTVRLVKYAGGAKRDDVILWQDASGKYLLHRVVRVTDVGYITRGDNRRRNDPAVAEAQVAAVLDGYYKGERFVSVASCRYRMYVATWGRPNPVRAVILWLRDLARRALGKKPKH